MSQVGLNFDRRLVQVRFVGFPEESELERTFVEIRTAALKLKAQHSFFNLLVDLREAAVLPAERLAMVQKEVGWQKENGLRKTAILVSSILVKLQVLRVAPDQEVGWFAAEEEALRWLED